MASSMFISCSSSTASHVIHSNHPNFGFLPRRSVGQLYLRTTAPRRFGQLCLRTTSSRRGCIDNDSSLPYDTISIDPISMIHEILSENKTEVSRMEKSIGAVPGLAIIMVGNIALYDRYMMTCLVCGMNTFVVRLGEDSSEEEVLEYVSRFNDDPCVHGIHVQLPLPSHMDEQKIFNAVSIEKDVDGFHPQNIGRLTMQGIEPICVPPAPKACIELIRRYNLKTNGKRAVVLGKSYRFSMPAALLLQREGAIVTIIHSKTKKPTKITRQADIIISDFGKQNMVIDSWIKPGAVFIDVGSRRVTIGIHSTRDVCYEEMRKAEFRKVASANILASVLVIMMRLSNVLALAKRSHNFI